MLLAKKAKHFMCAIFPCLQRTSWPACKKKKQILEIKRFELHCCVFQKKKKCYILYCVG